MKEYLECFSKNRKPTDDIWSCYRNIQCQTMEDEMEEFMFLGLRCMRGIEKKEFEKRFGKSVESVYGNVMAKYTQLGLLSEQNGKLCLTDRGIDVSNVVMAEFLL